MVVEQERAAGREHRSDGLVSCENLVKIYKTAELEAVALQGLDLTVARGEFIAIVGSSGSGKSTLLNILGGVDTPTAGEVRVGGHDLLTMRAPERARYRRRVVGFVWQQTTRNLLAHLSARENIELPMALDGRRVRARRLRALELLDQVGLGARRDHRPAELSGGEQQRVGIAVAMANEPDVLLADEPTGELDSQTAGDVVDLLSAINERDGLTVIVVTHDPLIADHVKRTVAIRDGRISSEVLRREATGGDGASRAEEFAVLDRVGRLQLPHEYVDALGLVERVRLTLDPDHVNVWPDRPPPSGGSDD